MTGLDIAWDCGKAKFRYRAAAVMTVSEKILIMRDVGYSIWYLPGGKVRMGETAEEAVLRELHEELNVETKIVRPLWIHQNFFTEYGSGASCHEICVYFLIDSAGTGLDTAGQPFVITEKEDTHYFEWVDFSELAGRNVCPEFLQKAVYQLPEHMELLSEWHDVKRSGLLWTKK